MKRNSKQFIHYRNLEKKKIKGDLPVLFNREESCCGCAACYNICPQKAIFMMPDRKGFLYPVIDASRCIGCYKCISVCVFKKDQKR